MNAPVRTYQFTPEPSAAFAELDEVRVLAPVRTIKGETIPAGSEGTVLAVWAEGAAYEVEFDLGLVTVEGHHLVTAT